MSLASLYVQAVLNEVMLVNMGRAASTWSSIRSAVTGFDLGIADRFLAPSRPTFFIDQKKSHGNTFQNRKVHMTGNWVNHTQTRGYIVKGKLRSRLLKEKEDPKSKKGKRKEEEEEKGSFRLFPTFKIFVPSLTTYTLNFFPNSRANFQTQCLDCSGLQNTRAFEVLNKYSRRKCPKRQADSDRLLGHTTLLVTILTQRLSCFQTDGAVERQITPWNPQTGFGVSKIPGGLELGHGKLWWLCIAIGIVIFPLYRNVPELRTTIETPLGHQGETASFAVGNRNM
ncbi:hypothetical protein C8J56DRAFT_891403 [Mycena floridula]|nr:hypothetical protein C8J56DRAFT_891403 [Mycena floridula]